MSKKINIKSIAAEFGVSPSTVSKALKDSYEISKKTREKIQAYAKHYNYVPNSLALSLRNKKTMVLGVIIPEIAHHFFSRATYGIESAAYNNDYNLMISLSKDSLEKEIQNISMLSNGSVDGLLVSVAKETFEKNDYAHFNRLIEEGFPIVFFDRVPPELEIDKVIIDDVAGGYKAAMHLIEKGYKNLAILTTPRHVDIGKKREIGFKKAIAEKGLNCKADYCFYIDEKHDIEEQISHLFELETRPDAVFAVNEIYASTTLRIAQKRGLRVPNDIAIIGFTDGLISKVTTPRLTTVAQHGYTMGVQATEILLKRIADKDTKLPHQNIVISTNVVEREST